MTRCCICMVWFHDECINEGPMVGIWTCLNCRTLPAQVSKLSSQISDLCRELVSLQSTNMELVHILGRKSMECDKLQEERANLTITHKQNVATSTSVTTNIASDNLPQNGVTKIKITVVGTSLVKGFGVRLKSDKTDTCVYVKPGNNLMQLRSSIPNIVNNNPDLVVLQAGSIDVTQYDDDAVIHEYRRTINSLKSCTSDKTTIFLSGIPMRKNRVHEYSARRVNSFLRQASLSDPRLQVIDNDNIILEDLSEDGIHLTPSGKNKLADNIKRQIGIWIEKQDFTMNYVRDFPPLERQNNR